MDFLQRLTNGSLREGCFLEPGSSKVDASLVCHEVRSVQLAPEERLRVSFRDLSVPGRDQFAALGEIVGLKALELGATVQVRAWAQHPNDKNQQRLCAELRIPMKSLVQRCQSCLYHTWVALDDPGLNDSIGSSGMLMGTDDGQAFELALTNGPKHLLQPKACLSLLPTSRLPRNSNGKVSWPEDLSNDLRVAQWAPLLRSQQQHVIMCQAQFLAMQRGMRGLDGSAGSTFDGVGGDVATLERELQAKAAEAERLRGRVAELEASGGAAPSRAASQQHQGEVEALTQELEYMRVEANRSIDGANERIRELKQEKKDTAAQLSRLTQENEELARKASELEHLVHTRSLEAASKYEQVRTLEGTIRVRERETAEQGQRDARIRDLEAKEQQQRLEITGLRSQLDMVSEEANAKIKAANERARDKESKLEVAERLGKELASAQLDLTTSFKMQQGEREVLQSRVRELEDMATTFRAQDGKAKGDRDLMEARLKHLEERELTFAKEVDQVRSSGEEYRRDLAEVRRELEAAGVSGSGQGSARSGSLVAQVRSVLRDREEFQRKASRAEQEVRRLTDTLTSGEQEMRKLKEKFATLEQENAKLRQRYEDNCRHLDQLASLLDKGDPDAMRRSIASLHDLRLH